MLTLNGRVAVVTGAASGIGRAMAVRFAEEGMRVVLADIERPALDAALAKLQGLGADAVACPTDVSRREDVEQLAKQTIDAFGAVHVLCNNAGVESGAPFAEIPPETWDWVMGVNFQGVCHGCSVFLPLLRQHDEGHIVNTASIGALNGFLPTGTPYVASKFAVLGLSENLHHELAAAGDPIGISVLCPGFVNTNMPTSERNRPDGVPAMDRHPARAPMLDVMRRAAEAIGLDPAEVADMVVQAIRDRRFYVLPHLDEAVGAVRARLRWMTDGIPPPPPPDPSPAEEAAQRAADRPAAGVIRD